MNHFRKHVNLIRLTALALTGTFLQSCMHWSAKPVAPEQFTGPEHAHRVRVRLVDGEQLLIKDPVISGDSLVWMEKVERKGIPLAAIKEIEVREVDALATTVLVVAGIGITALIVAVATYHVPSTTCQGSCYESCPVVYSWDGREWRLDSGTFGGAIVRALARTDVDNLDFATPQDGVLRLKLANELDETDYVDALTVLVVDHDSGVTVAPDGTGTLHSVGSLTLPERARDFRGDDVLARVRAADGWNWESRPARRDTAAVADIRDGIELAFPKPVGAQAARLVVDGSNTPWTAEMLRAFVSAHGRATQAWYDSLDAAPDRARQMFATLAREAFLGVSVWAGGRWERQGLVWEVPPEGAKRQILPLDLARVSGDTIRIRLESAPSFWLLDQVALDFSPERHLSVTELSATSAVDARAQDVRDPLAAADGRFFRMEPGDFAELRYDVPAIPRGQARTYLVRSTGWYRIHTPEVGEPDLALLNRVLTEPYAISRISVARMNETLRAMHLSAQ
jgi:hypothetical protein